MGRSPCCVKEGVKKGPWTLEEDQKLLAYIQEHGHGSWRTLPLKAGLQRCGKSCRLRWTNYLRPDIKRGPFSLQEEQTIIQLHALLGNRWSAIATHLPMRTDNEIKNYWNTHLKKRLTRMGIDPMTHKPKNHNILSYGQPSKDVANLSHMAQWESARLQAEARLVRESRMAHNHHQFSQSQLISESINLAIPSVGLLHECSFVTGINVYEDEVKNIMENSVMKFHDVTEPNYDSNNYFSDSLRFPGFMEGFTEFPPSIVCTNGDSDHNVVGGCVGVFEENKISYWSNELNVASSSTMGSSAF